MNPSKQTIAILLVAFLIIIGPAQNVQAKSLYAITNHSNSTISSYKISGDEIQKQTETNVDWGEGAVGLALDPDSATLFVSYDDSQKLELINAKTMTEIKNITALYELAGLVFDQSKQKLYAVGRQTDKLFVYQWDGATKTLTLEDDSPRILENISEQYRAFGISLDEDDQRLFVTDKTNAVKYYSTVDWSYQGSIDIVVDGNDRVAVGIALYDDGQGSKYLYTGGYVHGQLNPFLVRSDITDINEPVFTEHDVGNDNAVIGATVNQETGLVYITTLNKHIEIYNNATFPTDPCCTETTGISGPADIIVRGDVSYKDPFATLTLVKEDDIVDCVVPNNEITYTITYNANNDSDTNVVITDYLPVGVDPNNPSDLNYNSEKRTYTWNIGTLEPNQSGSVKLKVVVNNLAEPLGTITNYCEIEGDQYYTGFATVDTNVCCWGGDIIYVDENAPGLNSGLSWQHAYRDLQDALERAQGCGSKIWVAEGTYPAKNR